MQKKADMIRFDEHQWMIHAKKTTRKEEMTVAGKRNRTLLLKANNLSLIILCNMHLRNMYKITVEHYIIYCVSCFEKKTDVKCDAFVIKHHVI